MPLLQPLDPAVDRAARRTKRAAIVRAALGFFALSAGCAMLWGLGTVGLGHATWRAAVNRLVPLVVTMAVVAPVWAWVMWHAGYVRPPGSPARHDRGAAG